MLSKIQKQWAAIITLAIVGYFLYSSNQLLHSILGRLYLVGIVVLAANTKPMYGIVAAFLVILLYVQMGGYLEGLETKTDASPDLANIDIASLTGKVNSMLQSLDKTKGKKEAFDETASPDKLVAEHALRSKPSNKKTGIVSGPPASTSAPPEGFCSGKKHNQHQLNYSEY
jgi:hypothetical protein